MFRDEGTRIVGRGTFVVRDEVHEGVPFDLAIDLPEQHERGVPRVRETAGRIPIDDDRHVDRDGTLCVVLPDAYWYEHPDGLWLRDFLAGPLKGYLACQALIEAGVQNPWPQGEWPHGNDGVALFYGDLLGISDAATIARLVRVALRSHTGGIGKCPCRSGRAFNSCHSAKVFRMRRRIPRDQLHRALQRLPGAS